MRGSIREQKPADQRRTHKSPMRDRTVVERDGEVRGPTLAEATGRAEWPPAVVAWWETWRHAPQAAVFEDTDWRRLTMLVPLVAGYWIKPTAAAMAEVRRTEENLGATFVDRMRAKIFIRDDDEQSDTDAEEAQQARVTDIRTRLRGGADRS